MTSFSPGGPFSALSLTRMTSVAAHELVVAGRTGPQSIVSKEGIQGTSDNVLTLVAGMKVSERRLEVGVAEQLLKRPRVGSLT